MSVEIERKWLVNTNFEIPIEDDTPLKKIEQAYIVNTKSRSVRIRKSNWGYILTTKGKSTDDGLSRPEKEWDLPSFIGAPLLFLFGRKSIKKTRYIVGFHDQNFEVDFFEGRHEGLVLIELELKSVDEAVTLPPWVGKEVTGDPDYYNATLIKQ
ncbi:hypothetical protein [Vibrio crassostreae]|uniref:CYTH domain-containing protein n=1 Tax=Vibrio crassostreae TaxID=246167 RepID=UPI001B30E58F|nr:hypothetical protein [Vibrio crassostreae]